MFVLILKRVKNFVRKTRENKNHKKMADNFDPKSSTKLGINRLGTQGRTSIQLILNLTCMIDKMNPTFRPETA